VRTYDTLLDHRIGIDVIPVREASCFSCAGRGMSQPDRKEDDMIASIERRSEWKRRLAELRRPVAILTTLTVALTILVLLVVRMIGSELTMMALSLMFFVSALLVATIAWFVRSRHNSRSLSLWDVAGAFVIIGISASVLADPEHAVELFEHLFERRFVLH